MSPSHTTRLSSDQWLVLIVANNNDVVLELRIVSTSHDLVFSSLMELDENSTHNHGKTDANATKLSKMASMAISSTIYPVSNLDFERII